MSSDNTKNNYAQKTTRWWRTGTGLLVLGCVLLLGSLLLRQLPPWRLDFSEDKLFTLSTGTRAILRNLDADIELTFYFSDQAARELPQLRDYATRVQELLREYELISAGKLTLNVIDPEPFSEAEDNATQAGLQGVPSRPGGDAIFFGLVAERMSQSTESSDTKTGAETDSETEDNFAAGDAQEIISFFNPEREAFLEYDLSQLIYKLAHPKPTVIGVLTAAQILGGMDFANQRRIDPWLSLEQLKQLAEVRELEMEADVIDADVDILMVVHPQNLSEKTLYAIDQFILGGGRAILVVDPQAEMIAAAQGMMGMFAPNSSDLKPLFDTWGISFDPTKVVGDGEWALRLPAGERGLQLPHLGIIGVGEDSLNRDDITTAELETVNFATAGFFATTVDAAVQLQPLITSSDKAMPMESSRFVQLSDHSQLLRDFMPTNEVYTLVARVRGEVTSAFPDGPPSIPEDEGAEESADATDEETSEEDAVDNQSENIIPEHLSASQGSINVILIADTDMLTDRLWVQVSNFFGQRVAAPWANNGDLLSNVVESLAGSSDLISVRSRGSFARPFTVVEELELAAAERFQEQEQVLVDKLEELENNIQQLSQNAEGQIVLELNPEQEQEIRRFEEEKLTIRKELRQVQHQLNQDIDALHTQLKFLNILLIPLLLIIALIGVAAEKARRRRVSRLLD